MKDPQDMDAYLTRLRRRYRRIFSLDQCVWALYALSALLPMRELVTRSEGQLFHALGIIAILTTVHFGWLSNMSLKRSHRIGYGLAVTTTTLLFSTRVAMFLWGMSMFLTSASMDWNELDWFGEMGIGLTYLVFIVGLYRFIYHVAVHYYVRIFIDLRA